MIDDMLSDLSARLNQIPHSRALGIKVVSLSSAECELRLPYHEQLVGDPDSGVIHGGAVTTLLDNVAGVIAWASSRDTKNVSIATLDMRIDYLGKATPGRDIHARASCYKKTRNVAFVRGQAFHDAAREPIAVCVATFMIGTPNAPLANPSK